MANYLLASKATRTPASGSEQDTSDGLAPDNEWGSQRRKRQKASLFVQAQTRKRPTKLLCINHCCQFATASIVTVSGLAISGITGSNSSQATDYVLNATSKTVAATITKKDVSVGE